jgi:hypothetical protein
LLGVEVAAGISGHLSRLVARLKND